MSKVNIKETIQQYINAKQELEQLNKKLKRNKLIMSKYLESKGLANYTYNGLTMYEIEKNSFDFDIDKLNKKLKKSLLNQFIDVKMVISNKKQFKKICDKYDIPIKLFKNCIDIEKQVNIKKLNSLSDKGIISLEDLEGCYEVNNNKSIGIRFK